MRLDILRLLVKVKELTIINPGTITLKPYFPAMFDAYCMYMKCNQHSKQMSAIKFYTYICVKSGELGMKNLLGKSDDQIREISDTI